MNRKNPSHIRIIKNVSTHDNLILRFEVTTRAPARTGI